MPEAALQGYPIEDPAPHGHRVGLVLLFSALLASPLAWISQLVVIYGLASHACFPRDMPRATVLHGWHWVWWAVLALNIAMLLVAIVATVISLRSWRMTNEEASGGHDHLVEAGEGRTRFLAVWGIWTGVWFALAIGFNTISVFGVPLCGS